MDPELYEQIEVAIDVLRLAHTRIGHASQMLRKRRRGFGLDHDRTHDYIAQVMSKERYMRRGAERREVSGS